jgi:hypothetical protein
MVLPELRAYITDNFATQADAARSLHLSVQQFSRLVNGATPIGWNLVGRTWYYWHYQKNLPGSERIVAIIGNYVFERNGNAR